MGHRLTCPHTMEYAVSVDVTPVPLRPGDLAWYDAYGARVACRLSRIVWCREGLFGPVEEDACRLDARREAPGLYVEIEVTATKRAAYRRGERMLVDAAGVVPRNSLVRRGGVYRVVANWHLVDTTGARYEVFAR